MSDRLEEFVHMYRRCNPRNEEDMRLLMAEALRIGYRPHFVKAGNSSYMIRNAQGQHSDGKIPPSWGSDGYRWQSMQEVQSYLMQFGRVKQRVSDHYKGCHIVEYQLELVTEQPVEQTFRRILEQRRRAEQERRRRLQARQEKRQVVEEATEDFGRLLQDSNLSPGQIKKMVETLKRKVKK